MRTLERLGFGLVLAGALAAGAAAQQADAPSTAAAPAHGLDEAVFARIDDRVVTVREFAAALQEAVRRKFYHGKVPQAEMARFQREVGDLLVDRVLLMREAERRRIEPDSAWVDSRLEAFEARYGKHPKWGESRDQALAALRGQLETQSRIEQLEARVRDVTPPTPAELRAYYDANPGKFTDPERFRVSAILLAVDPSASTAVWEAAMTEAAALVEKLRAGADFAELARLHSSDPSAATGGDMGYLHRGMLGAPAQKAVDEAAVGEVTDPVRLLEGAGIFRVDERPVSRLRPYDEVAERAEQLWLRERREAAWDGFVRGLRDAAVIHVDTQYYLPLPQDEAAKG